MRVALFPERYINIYPAIQGWEPEPTFLKLLRSIRIFAGKPDRAFVYSIGDRTP